MAKSLIIPDIHLKTALAESIILRRESECDGTVLLGDIFHAFGDGIYENEAAAQWLCGKLEREDYIVIAGNHDAGHYWPTIYSLTNCPGWTSSKHRIIAPYLSKKHVAKVKLAAWIDGWLLSHAGINPYFAKTSDQIDDVVGNCLAAIQYGKFHELLKWGSRMDPRPIHPGGILWQDWDDEFRPVPGVCQIVGHTPNKFVRQEWSADGTSVNVCLDTALNHYAIIDDGVVIVYDINHTAVQEIRKPLVNAGA